MIILASEIAIFSQFLGVRILPFSAYGLSLPLACELDEKPFKNGVITAKQRMFFPNAMKDLPDLLFRVPSTRFGGLPCDR